MSEAPASVEAAHLLAFERLCRRCQFLLPHPLYEHTIHCEEGTLLLILPNEDEGPRCHAGLAPLTRSGDDCPYFKKVSDA